MKKALIIGINDYPDCPLQCCVPDAESLALLLANNADGSANFDVQLFKNTRTKQALKGLIHDLFSGDPEIALFYFAGHGAVTHTGTYLVTPDAKRNDVGISLDEILIMANNSNARNRVIILDSCYSGAFGNPVVIGGEAAHINPGVTILTASRQDENAAEINGHGVFTNLLLEALRGGAADLKGNVTPASVYAFIDQALSSWQQRPVFKTNTSRFISLRTSPAPVPLQVLQKLTTYFAAPLDELALNPSFEETNAKQVKHKIIPPVADPVNVAKFKDLQKMQKVGLVVPVGEEHMYFAAMHKKTCKLTPLGYHYWRLIKENLI